VVGDRLNGSVPPCIYRQIASKCVGPFGPLTRKVEREGGREGAKAISEYLISGVSRCQLEAQRICPTFTGVPKCSVFETDSVIKVPLGGRQLSRTFELDLTCSCFPNSGLTGSYSVCKVELQRGPQPPKLRPRFRRTPVLAELKTPIAFPCAVHISGGRGWPCSVG
jgi:hypothetical protein